MSDQPQPRGFLERSNDLTCRDLICRAFRSIRARVRQAGLNAALLADEPRVWRAWARRWEAVHYAQLLRWREEGFRPRVVFDVGAHCGLWSEMCQSVFAPETCILFEPQVERHAEIRVRQERVGGNWQVLPVALGDREQSATIHVNRQSAASSLLAPDADAPREYWGGAELRQEVIRVAGLDALVAEQLLPPPDLVKIDVQGFEARVLAGGAAILRRAERMVIEVSLRPIYAGQPLCAEILQMLTDCGFVLEDANEALRRWPRGGLWQMDLWLKNTARSV